MTADNRRRVRVSIAKLVHQAGNVRELESAVDPGVGGEDLLEQGRAGTRHTYNKDGIRERASHTRARSKKFTGAHQRLTPHGLNEGLRVDGNFRAFECIAARVVCEGLRILRAFLQRLAEREA